MSFSLAIHKSDRKAEQLLGVYLTRQHPPSPKKPDSILDKIRKRLRFPKKPRSDTISDDDDDDDGHHIVWDEPNPFAPPDPTLAHLRALINAEIARTRRYESIGPFDPVDDDDTSGYDSDSDSDGYSDSDGQVADDEDEDHGDGDSDGQVADDEDSVSDHGGRDVDYDDRIANVRDNDADADCEDNRLAPILLPRLLPIPLRFIPSPPPPSPSPSDKDLSTPWADPARVYNDIAEARERAARKANRDAHRSRSKALAILGPEASSAL